NTGITGATTLYAKWTPLPRYQVTFDTDGGTAVASQQVVMGEKAVAPADPTKSAYAFKGWFTSKSGTENFNFNTTPITTNITVYAQWVSIIM
ncbi:MAG: InlB B-repeat-containing protein, partial [Lachnospiraceae bacterium]